MVVLVAGQGGVGAGPVLNRSRPFAANDPPILMACEGKSARRGLERSSTPDTRTMASSAAADARDQLDPTGLLSFSAFATISFSVARVAPT